MFNLPDAQQPELKTVTYLGGELKVPVNHNWVAVIKMGAAAYHACLLASFANKPVLGETGVQYVPVDKDFTILGQVEHVNPEELVNSLRQVDGYQDNLEILLANSEELAYKIGAIVSNPELTKEGKLHALFCKDHGVFSEFVAYSGDTIEALLDAQDEAEEEEEGEIPAEVQAALKQAVDKFLTEAAEATAEQPAKPRIRVIHAGSIEEALAQLGLNQQR
jgi:hypothetical protein